MRATRLVPALVTPLLVAALAAGCAAPAAPVPATAGTAAPDGPVTAAPSPTAAVGPPPSGPSGPSAPTADARPTTGPADDPAPGGAAPAVDLPWPARTPAEAADLQDAVDAGAQAWLLDPEETALSYAGAALGWTGAGTERPAPDTVLVTGPGGARRTLTVVQPARSGPGGIWTVAADRETPNG